MLYVSPFTHISLKVWYKIIYVCYMPKNSCSPSGDVFAWETKWSRSGHPLAEFTYEATYMAKQARFVDYDSHRGEDRAQQWDVIINSLRFRYFNV